MEKNQKILQAFENGNFPGSDTKNPKVITTAISNVFLCDKKAYKIYVGDSKFFNENFRDISVKENRFSFTRKDFIWNNKLSPEIYLEVKGLVWQNGEVVFTDPDDTADDLLIVMNKIDMSDGLLEKLKKNLVSLDDCYQIGLQLGKRILSLSLPNIKRDLYLDFISRHKDMVAWVSGAEKYIPKEEAKKYLDILLSFIESYKPLFQNNSDLIGPCLDVHADNGVLTGKTFLPIDTYAPKEDWLYGFKFINIYRVATDIHAFLGKEYFDQVLKGYEDSTKEKLPREMDKFMLLYCELITCPYQYMLSEKDPSRLDVAKRYHSFLKDLL